jgi:hypothetical protein
VAGSATFNYRLGGVENPVHVSFSSLSL